MKRNYYGFEFTDATNTLTGFPNRQTGRLDIAGNLFAFNSKKERDEWVEEGCNSIGGRVVTNKADARKYHRGMTLEDYLELVELTEPDESLEKE